ncbi:unnamed protein product [Gulo gulo]|uniref:Uncharacterized protein n=1 Tax=Gulo gulo TaxID=48420 RepID=A0A9X9M641_GULGU|nr:unnamed protein product [Gulo gulo]
MSIVHKTLCKLSLEGDQLIPRSAYGPFKAHTNFGAECAVLNIEKAIKTKSVDEVTTVNNLTNHSNEQRKYIAFTYERRTKNELAPAMKSAFLGTWEP